MNLLIMKTLFASFILLSAYKLLLAQLAETFEFTSQPSDTIAKPKQPIVLSCNAQSSSPGQLVYRWRKDGQLLNLNDNHYKLLSNGSLMIMNPTHQRSGYSDRGIYQCLVSLQSKRLVSRKAHVIIAFIAGDFSEQPKDLQLNLGDTLLLRCKVLAAPVARFVWFRNSGQIIPDDRVKIFPQGVLQISNMQTNDFGSYRCRASNVYGYVDSRPALVAKIDRNPPGPFFTLKPENITTVHQGDDVMLFCGAAGVDSKGNKPTITWLNNRDVTVTETRDLANQAFGGLHIPKVLLNDAGSYICRMTSAEGSQDTRAYLEVLVPPYFIKKPPPVVTPKLNENLVLRCDVGGSPTPRTTWMKDGELIVASDYFQIIDQKHLHILGVLTSDAGMYQCMGENKVGAIQSSCNVVVSDDFVTTTSSSITFVQFGKDAPSTPTNLRSPINTPTSITLEWNPSTGKGSIWYTAYYTELGHSQERSVVSRQPTAQLSNLTKGSAYKVRVVAISDFGQSLPTESVLMRTASELSSSNDVAGPPIAVRLRPLSSRRIRVQWLPPNSRHPIQSYHVKYWKTRSGEHQAMYRISQAVSSTLTSLSPFTDYTIVIQAKTLTGMGQKSLESSARTFSDVPSAPPANVSMTADSSSSVSILWNPPPLDHRNGMITGYQIQYKRRSRRPTSISIEGRIYSYRISGLSRRTLYDVRITALTVNGTGRFSDWKKVKTRSTDLDETRVPGVPRGIIVQPQSDSAVIGWRTPADSGVVVGGYVIGYGHHGPYSNRIQLEAPKDLVFVIRGLKPNSRYVLTVKAYNTIGEGQPAYKDFTTLEEKADKGIDNKPLMPPIFVQAKAFGPHAIKVTWDEQSEEPNLRALSEQRFYTVRYARLDDDDDSPLSYRFANATEKRVTLNDLDANAEYEISVKVTLGQRSSFWSLKTTGQTAPTKPSSSPRDLTAVPVGGTSTSILLAWQPPRHQNGRITNYIIVYSTDVNVRIENWPHQEVPGDTLSTRLARLAPSTIYYFRIQAKNGQGFGPLSNTIIFKTGDISGHGGKVLKKLSTSGDSVNSNKVIKNEDHDLKEELERIRDTVLVTTAKPSQRKADFTHVMFAIVGGLAGLLLTLICIVLVVIYRRRKTRARNSKKRSDKPREQPPDLWIHDRNLELTRLENNSECDPMLGSSTMSSRGRSSSDRNRHSFIDQSLSSPIDEEQRFLVRSNVPNRMNVESPHRYVECPQQQPLSISPGLLTQSQGSLRPYNQYPTPPPYPSETVIISKPLQSHHMPMKIPLINPLKCPPLAVQTPHAPSSQGTLKGQKSTEDLSAEMANLEGVMKDLQTALNHNNEIFM